MKIPLLRYAVVAPGRLLDSREDHSFIGAGWAFLCPDIPIAILRLRVAPRLLKPFVFVRGVIHHEIDNDPNAALRSRVGEFNEIAEAAVGRVDAVITRNIVAVVASRGGLERHQPNRGYAEAVQIIQTAHQALEVTGPITVGVHVGAD
jgi:hypothetical protein